MNKHEISEALYALPGGAVVRRRCSLLIPAALLLGGAALLAANRIWAAQLSVDLRSALVFLGGAAAVTGAVWLLARLCGTQGVPYHREARCFLRYEELYFDRSHAAEVRQYVDRGEVRRVLALGRAQVPAVAVALFRTPDNRFVAMRAFEYVDLEYRPLTELKVVEA